MGPRWFSTMLGPRQSPKAAPETVRKEQSPVDRLTASVQHADNARPVAGAVPAVPSALELAANILQPPPIPQQHEVGRVCLVAAHQPDSIAALHSDLLKQHRHVAFLDSINNIDSLLGETYVDSKGKFVTQAGDLENVFTSGGALLIDAREFSSHELESFNTLMTEPPRFRNRLVHPDTQIVVVLPETSIEAEKHASSFMSRIENIVEIPEASTRVSQIANLSDVNSAEANAAAHVHLGAVPNASEHLFGRLCLGSDGKFENVAGELAKAIQQNNPYVVLHNAPWDDLAFVAKMETMLARGGFMHQGQWLNLGNVQLLRVDGHDDADFRSAKQQLRLAPGSEAPPESLIVNSENFSKLFERTIIRNKRLASKNGLLSEERPLRIVGDLLPWQWNRLFALGMNRTHYIDSHVRVPARWAGAEWDAQRIVCSPETRPLAALSQNNAPCTVVVRSTDVSMSEAELRLMFGNCRMVTVATETTTAELIESIDIQYPQNATLPVARQSTQSMMRALIDGETVVIRGLAHNAELRESLAPLLYGTPPYAIVNGECIAITGRLIVLDEQVGGAWTIRNTDTVYVASAHPTPENYFRVLSKEFVWLKPADLEKLLELCPNLESLRKVLKLCRPLKGTLSPHAWQRAIMAALAAPYQEQPEKYAEFRAQVREVFANGASESVLSPRRSPEQQWERRLEKCVNILRRYPALFLQGPPGAGKSYITAQIARELGDSQVFGPINMGPHTRQSELLGDGSGGIISRWARSTHVGPKVLVIDEANLAEDHFWEFLRGAFNTPPTININGELVRLSPEHKIIFTGNSDRFPGRKSQTLVRESFVTMVFPEQTPEFLAEQIIAPSLSFLGPQAASATRMLAELHAQAKILLPNAAFSPRDIFECAARVQAGSQNGTDVRLLVAKAWTEVYLGRLPLAQRPAVDAWLQRRFGVELEARNISLDANELTITESVQFYAQRLDATLNMHQERCIHANASARGKFGMLIEGPAGRGKDDVLLATLTARGYQMYQKETREVARSYCVLNGGGDLEEIKAQINRARQEGGIIILQELNLLPSDILEGLLNNAVDGGAHPAFFLFATINPDNFPGRSPLSQAFLNRVVCETLDDYPPSELCRIMQQAGSLRQDVAQNIVDRHLAMAERLRAAGKYTRPTPREALRVAKLVAAGVPIGLAFGRVYAKYELLLPSEKVGEAESVLRQSPDLDAELQALARLTARDKSIAVIRSEYAAPSGNYSAKNNTIVIRGDADANEQKAQVRMQAAHARYSCFRTPTTPWQIALEAARVKNCLWSMEMDGDEGATIAADEVLAQLSESERQVLQRNAGGEWLLKAAVSVLLEMVPSKNADQQEIDAMASRAAEFLVELSVVPKPQARIADQPVAVDVVSFKPQTASRAVSNIAPRAVRLGAVDLNMESWRTIGRLFMDKAERVVYCANEYFDSWAPNGSRIASSGVRSEASLVQPLQKCGEVQLDAPKKISTGNQFYYALPLPPNTAIGNLIIEPPLPNTGVVRTQSGELMLDTGSQPITSILYSLLSAVEAPEDIPNIRQLPFACNAENLWPDLHAQLDRIAKGNLAPDQKLHAMCDAFKFGCTYDKSPQCAAAYESAAKQTSNEVQQVLIVRHGVCRHFATAFAALAQEYLQVPVRVVSGNSITDGVIAHVGHAWVEAYIQGQGWITLDPTTSNMESQTAAAIAQSSPEAALRISADAILEQHARCEHAAAEQKELESSAPKLVVLEALHVHLSEEAVNYPERIVARLEERHPDWFSTRPALRTRYSKTANGTLDPQRVIARKPDIFAQSVCGADKTPKRIIVVPDFLQGEAWADDIHALIVSGAQVEISMPDGSWVHPRSVGEVARAIQITHQERKRRVAELEIGPGAVQYYPASLDREVGKNTSVLLAVLEQLHLSSEGIMENESEAVIQLRADTVTQKYLSTVSMSNNGTSVQIAMEGTGDDDAMLILSIVNALERVCPNLKELTIAKDKACSEDLYITRFSNLEVFKCSGFRSVTVWGDSGSFKVIELKNGHELRYSSVEGDSVAIECDRTIRLMRVENNAELYQACRRKYKEAIVEARG